MTLFGQDFDGQQLFGLVSLLTLLVFWLLVLRRERGHARWFRRWEADRKARRQAEQDRDPDRPRSGPWG